MGMEVDFSEPWLEAGPYQPSPLQTPQYAQVSIAGRPYPVVDTSFEPYRRDAFRHRSIQSQRESISLDNIPGVGTVNTEGLWRREAWDWRYGAGQPYQDRKDSVDARFSTSKGINPWMQWQAELLNDTHNVYPTRGGAVVVQCGEYTYVLDLVSQLLQFSSDLVHWTPVSVAGVSKNGLATDGYNLWISNDAQPSGPGMFTTTAGSTTSTTYSGSQPFDGVYYVGDRLMATFLNNVYNLTDISGSVFQGTLTTGLTASSTVTSLAVTATLHDIPTGSSVQVGPIFSGGPHTQVFTTVGDTPVGSTTINVTSATANFTYPIGVSVFYLAPNATALWTHPSSGFRFSDMAAGSSQIYMAGYVQTTSTPLASLVYRTTIEATGTALTIPVQALPMEGGEYCTSLYGYLNYVFVGSNLGVRMCRTIAAYDPTGNEGDLEAGPLLPGLYPPGPVNSPVFSMVGNNRFVYFGWTNYDDESTGLGRCDLSTFIDTQAPAFASDLMVPGVGNVTAMDWCTISDAPIFAVQGQGIFTATSEPVETGYVTSGYYGYGISDNKIALAGDIGAVQPQQGTITMSLATDAGANIFAFVGQQVSASQGGTPNESVFAINPTRGELFTLKLTLTRDPVTDESPIMHRWTLKALPGVTAGTTISVVLALWETENVQGQDAWCDPYEEKAFLENLRVTQTLFPYVEGPYTAPLCTVDEIDWLPEKYRDANVAGGFQGNIIVYLKTWEING